MKPGSSLEDAYLAGIGVGVSGYDLPLISKTTVGMLLKLSQSMSNKKEQREEILLEGRWVRSDCQRSQRKCDLTARESQAGPLALLELSREICYSEDPREVLGSQGVTVMGTTSSSPGTDTSWRQDGDKRGLASMSPLQAQPELPGHWEHLADREKRGDSLVEGIAKLRVRDV